MKWSEHCKLARFCMSNLPVLVLLYCGPHFGAEEVGSGVYEPTAARRTPERPLG